MASGLTGLHVCPDCDGQLVYPIAWHCESRWRWYVELRCPDCEWWGDGVFSQGEVERFDEVLDEGTDELAADLRAIMQANFQDEIGAFVYALNHDHIFPEDF